jgi:hypothetical protein
MDTANASNDSLEQFWNQILDLVNLAYLKHFLELSKEECFLDAVGKGPVSKKTFEKVHG